MNTTELHTEANRTIAFLRGTTVHAPEQSIFNIRLNNLEDIVAQLMKCSKDNQRAGTTPRVRPAKVLEDPTPVNGKDYVQYSPPKRKHHDGCRCMACVPKYEISYKGGER